VRSARDPQSYHLSPRLDPRPPEDSAGCWQAISRAAARVAGSQDSKARHAVLIEPGLRSLSPENGNISNIYQRLSAISLSDCRNWELGDGAPMCKRPQLAGIYAISVRTISS